MGGKTICRVNFAAVGIVTSLSGLAYKQIILHSKFCRFINCILKQEHAVSYPAPLYVCDFLMCLQATGKQGEGGMYMQTPQKTWMEYVA